MEEIERVGLDIHSEESPETPPLTYRAAFEQLYNLISYYGLPVVLGQADGVQAIKEIADAAGELNRQLAV